MFVIFIDKTKECQSLRLSLTLLPDGCIPYKFTLSSLCCLAGVDEAAGFPSSGLTSVEAANIFDRYFSRKFSKSSQNPGTKRVPAKALVAMPNTTAVPSAIRDWAPAPVANSIGRTPNTNANAVIMIGRKRMLPASVAACLTLRPVLWKSLAYSTIRMAFLAARPSSRIIPIWV